MGVKDWVILILGIWFVASLILAFIFIKVFEKNKTEISALKIDLAKSQAQADYANMMLKTKTDAERKANEEKRKLDKGDDRERFDNALDVMCDKD